MLLPLVQNNTIYIPPWSLPKGQHGTAAFLLREGHHAKRITIHDSPKKVCLNPVAESNYKSSGTLGNWILPPARLYLCLCCYATQRYCWVTHRLIIMFDQSFSTSLTWSSGCKLSSIQGQYDEERKAFRCRAYLAKWYTNLKQPSTARSPLTSWPTVSTKYPPPRTSSARRMPSRLPWPRTASYPLPSSATWFVPSPTKLPRKQATIWWARWPPWRPQLRSWKHRRGTATVKRIFAERVRPSVAMPPPKVGQPLGQETLPQPLQKNHPKATRTTHPAGGKGPPPPGSAAHSVGGEEGDGRLWVPPWPLSLRPPKRSAGSWGYPSRRVFCVALQPCFPWPYPWEVTATCNGENNGAWN